MIDKRPDAIGSKLLGDAQMPEQIRIQRRINRFLAADEADQPDEKPEGEPRALRCFSRLSHVLIIGSNRS